MNYQLFSELMDPWPDASFLMSKDGEIIKANLAATKMTGPSGKAVAGKRLINFVTDSQDNILKYLSNCSCSKKPVPGVFHWKTPEETDLAYHCWGHLVRINQQDEPLVFLRFAPSPSQEDKCTALNKELEQLRLAHKELNDQTKQLSSEIRERKTVEKALALEKDRLNSIIESLKHPFYVINVDDYSIEMANKAAGFGSYSKGATCYQLTHNTDQPCGELNHSCPIQSIKRNKEPVIIDHIHCNQAGEDFVCEVHAFPIVDEKGQVKQIIEYTIDVTDRRRMEEEVANIKKLESTATLAGGIAHDFNNLLTAITGYAQLAQFELEEGRASQMLERIVSATGRAKELIKKFNAFSSGGTLVKQVASIADLTRDSIAVAICGSSVDSDFSIPGDVWPVKIDLGQMRQVISIIALNSIEAMPAGGTLQVAIENMTFAGQGAGSLKQLKEGRYVRITIQDKGRGIPERILPNIFDPYFSTKERGAEKGMGLGLSIVRSILRKHKGNVIIESTQGEGTTISLFIPAYESEGQSEATLQHHTVLPNRQENRVARILYMEDEELLRDMVKRMLLSFGHEVETACNGEEALQLYVNAQDAGVPFDIVLLDLTIKGGMGGLETFNKLHKLNSAVRAVICSGHNKSPIIEDYLEYGFKGALIKPFKIDEVEKIINQVLCH